MTEPTPQPSNRAWPRIIAAAVALALLYYFVASLRSSRLFDELGDDIAAITINDASTSLEMKRGKDAIWRIPAFGDASVDPVKVADLLQALQKAKRGEDKTADPALHETIGLGKAATNLQLRSSKGVLLVDLFLGSGSNADSNQRFARLAGEPQSFLLAGFGAVSSDGMMWTNIKPPKLESARLQQITLIEPNLQRMTLERDEDGIWSRTDAPTTNEAKASALADALSNLQAERLRSAESINWFNAHILLADSNDGLQLSLQAKREGTIVWVRLNAAARQDAEAAVVAEAAQINNLRQMAFAVKGDSAEAVTSSASAFILAK
jgi:Domain of unknown function (DUF4340)